VPREGSDMMLIKDVNGQRKNGWQVDIQAFFHLSCEYGTFFI
jgi:hypothetical protein